MCLKACGWIYLVGINQDGGSIYIYTTCGMAIVCLGRGLIYSEGHNVSCSYSIPYKEVDMVNA